ncbi:MAG: DUF2218 domain-containing protein [Pseudomonadota bacterium]
MQATASFQTSQANRYLVMLCDHFGKKVKAGCEGSTGWVTFPIGQCEIAANDRRLMLMASADDKTRLDQVIKVVTSHLERFAFRENPNLDWSDPADSSAKLTNNRSI